MRQLSFFLITIMLAGACASAPVFAQGEVGVIPAPQSTDCAETYKKGTPAAKVFDNDKAFREELKKDAQDPERKTLSDILGCAVKLGKVRLYMMPFFVTYIIQWMLGLAGLIAVLFIVVGGYKYVIGGMTEDKESGKKTLIHAIVGLLIALSSWIIVNFVQVALTT